jgi:hypothetical protein
MIASKRSNERYGKEAVNDVFFLFKSCMFPSYRLRAATWHDASSTNGARKYFLSKCFRSERCNLGNEVPR